MQQLVEPEGAHLQRHLASVNLREIQNVVQQPQQRLGSSLGLVGVVQLAFGQGGVVQQPEHAQNCVHRGADLVAHVGQKLALGHGGFFSLLFGELQRLLQILVGRDVGADANELVR